MIERGQSIRESASEQQIPKGNDRKKSNSLGCDRHALALDPVSGKEVSEVEGAGVHGEGAGGVAGPVGFGAVPVEFDAVVVGVAEVEGFADAVVGGAFELDVGVEEAAERAAELGASGIEDGEVVEAGGAGRGWAAAEALPGVDADVVVVAAGGEECGGVADALRDVEAEDAVVEGECAVEVGDAEVDVADAGLGMDGGGLESQGLGRAVAGWRSLALASRATFHWPFTFFQKVM